MKSLNPKNFSILPISLSPENIPENGLLQPLPNFCKKKFDARCQSHYKKIKAGFSKCPYGFASYTFPAEGRSITWTALKIKGHCNLNEIRARSSTIGSKVFSEAEIQEMSEMNINFVGQMDEVFNKKIETAQNALKTIEKHTLNAFHEIRPLNAEVKAAVHKMKVNLGNYKVPLSRDYDNLTAQLDVITGSSDIISIRMEQRDFLVNPATSQMQIQKWINIKKQFDILYHMFRTALRKEKITMNLQISEKHEIKSFEIFKIIPFVLLENALKYSPENIDQEIKVTESKTNESYLLCVNSRGPMINEDERELIFDAFYRGRNATNADGNGVGLFAARKIATLFDADLSVKQSKNSFNFNSTDYFDTTFELKIPIKRLRQHS